MLTKEQNELLSRVGPGTPAGELFRRYWIPALLSEEITEPGGPPVRVRLLGEDLIAFRDHNGDVGLLAERCAHRQASLFFARPEQGGIRCIYHGWMYRVDGKIMDMPCEPANSTFKDAVHHPAYPCRDVNGIIWTYMGPAEKMPLLPDTLWFTLPEDHLEILKFRNESSYLQGIEGECDHAHTAFLHRRGEGLTARYDPSSLQYEELQYTWWGVRAPMSMPIGDGKKRVQSNLFIYPFIGGVGGGGNHEGKDPRDSIHIIYHVPADDYHETRFDILCQRQKPRQRVYRLGYAKELNADYTKVANKENGYLLDRRAQQAHVFAGIPFGNHTQDAAVEESMGPIMDRTLEHLGASDQHVIAGRRCLFNALEAMERGEDPPGVAYTTEQNELFSDLYCVNGELPLEASWQELFVD